MKRFNSIIAIIGLAIVATALAFVSCKKETEKALSQKDYTIQQTADVRQIEDMNSYLKDFKKKMTESKGDEAYTLEDAAWHLASLANFDFCRINVEYNNVKFDTVEMQVNVTDGVVLLSDLNTAYEQMCTKIQQFKKEFTHNNQNLYFANVFINGNGNTKLALTTTFVTPTKDMGDHLWYFEDSFIYDTVCYFYFDGLTQYPWDGYGESELQRILNLYEHYENTQYIMCFNPTRNYSFSYPDWPDPYGNDFTGNSRVFAGDADYYATINLSQETMCYCLDSYLGLGYDYIEDNPLYDDEHPVNWIITDTIIQFEYHKHPTHMHVLTVQYGIPYIIDPGSGSEPGPGAN